MTDAVSGFGTLLKMGDGETPEVFTTIAEVKDITGPGMEAETIDVTNHSSQGSFREFLMALLDAGEVTFALNFLPGNATQDHTTGLLSVYLARQRPNFKLVWPTSPAEAVGFKAGVTGFEPSAPVDDALTADVTLKVSGAPDFSVTP